MKEMRRMGGSRASLLLVPLVALAACAGGDGSSAPAPPDLGDAGARADAAGPACTPCGDLCVHLASDPENCGRCGHDCQGGSCVAGRCGPVFFAHVADGAYGLPHALAVGHDDVYWGAGYNPCRIQTCPKAGCGGGPPVVIWQGRSCGSLVAAPSSNGQQDEVLYWLLQKVGGWELWSCVARACAETAASMASGPGNPGTLAVDDSRAFWIANQQVLSCPLSGCGGSPATFSELAEDYSDLTLDAAYVYWNSPKQIVRCAKTGCVGSAEPVTPVGWFGQEIEVDETTIYLDTTYWGTLWRAACPLASCTNPVHLLANEDLTPAPSFSQDETTLYWAPSGFWGGSGVYSVPKGSYAPKTVLDEKVLAVRIASDGPNVWFAGYDIGRIAK